MRPLQCGNLFEVPRTFDVSGEIEQQDVTSGNASLDPRDQYDSAIPRIARVRRGIVIPIVQSDGEPLIPERGGMID